MMLRAMGWSLRRIGAKMGVSHVEVLKLEREGLAATVSMIDHTLVDEVRARQLERCEELYDILSDGLYTEKVLPAKDGEEPEIVREPNPENLRAYLKVMEREAKILGTDAPERKEIERKKVSDFTTDAARKQAFEEMRRKYAKQDTPPAATTDTPSPDAQ
ncbi:MAG: hypothetical protein JSS75_07235 [Bacteroidetes bacterium]|nr:hypothetical protein [Bacteroidota bacterium]